MVASYRAHRIGLLQPGALTPMARAPESLPTHSLTSAKRASDGPMPQARDSPGPKQTIGFDPQPIQSEATATRETGPIGFGLPVRGQTESGASDQQPRDVAMVPEARETTRASGEIQTIPASVVFQEVADKAKECKVANRDFFVLSDDLSRFVDALYLLNWFVDSSPSDGELAREAQILFQNLDYQRKTDRTMRITPDGQLALEGLIPLVKNAESTISWDVRPLKLPGDIKKIAETNPTEVLSYIAGSYCSERDFGDPVQLGEEGSRVLTAALDSLERTLGNDSLSEQLLRELIPKFRENEPAWILTRDVAIDLRTLCSLAAEIARQNAHTEETTMTGQQSLRILMEILAKKRNASGGVGPLGDEMLQLKAVMDWITGEIKAGYRLQDSSDRRIVDEFLGVFRPYPFEPGGYLGQAGLALLERLVPIVEKMVGVSAAGPAPLGPTGAVAQPIGPGLDVVQQKASEVLGRVLRKLRGALEENGDSCVELEEDAQVLIDTFNSIRDGIDGSCLTKAERTELRRILSSWDYEGERDAKNVLMEYTALSKAGLEQLRRISELAERMESGERLVDIGPSGRSGRKKIRMGIVWLALIALAAMGVGIHILQNLNLGKKDKTAQHETAVPAQAEKKKPRDTVGVSNNAVDRGEGTEQEQKAGQTGTAQGQATGGSIAKRTGQSTSGTTGGTQVTAGKEKTQKSEANAISARGQLAGMGVAEEDIKVASDFGLAGTYKSISSTEVSPKPISLPGDKTAICLEYVVNTEGGVTGTIQEGIGFMVRTNTSKSSQLKRHEDVHYWGPGGNPFLYFDVARGKLRTHVTEYGPDDKPSPFSPELGKPFAIVVVFDKKNGTWEMLGESKYVPGADQAKPLVVISKGPLKPENLDTGSLDKVSVECGARATTNGRRSDKRIVLQIANPP